MQAGCSSNWSTGPSIENLPMGDVAAAATACGPQSWQTNLAPRLLSGEIWEWQGWDRSLFPDLQCKLFIPEPRISAVEYKISRVRFNLYDELHALSSFWTFLNYIMSYKNMQCIRNGDKNNASQGVILEPPFSGPESTVSTASCPKPPPIASQREDKKALIALIFDEYTRKVVISKWSKGYSTTVSMYSLYIFGSWLFTIMISSS